MDKKKEDAVDRFDRKVVEIIINIAVSMVTTIATVLFLTR